MHRFAFVLVLVTSSLAGQSAPPPADLVPVAEHVALAVDRGDAPSCAVAVIREGKIVWAQGFGKTRPGGEDPVTGESPYLLASISKPITATALMVLVERGLVDLDAPANRYLAPPGLRARVGDVRDVTIRRLANHTAGLPTHWSFFEEGNAPPSMEETIRRYGFSATAPGERWQYSNLAFGVLQHVTERVSGILWGEFLDREVFAPLGMTGSGVSWSQAMARGGVVPCEYRRQGGPRPCRPYDFDHPGASAIWGSAQDLARFLIFHMDDGRSGDRQVLEPSTVRAMRVPTGYRGKWSGTAIGWGVGRCHNEPTFGHSGGMPGVATVVQAFPRLRAGYVILTNVNRRDLANSTAAMLDRLLVPPDPAPWELWPDRQEDPPPSPATEPAAAQGDFVGWLHHHTGPVAVHLSCAPAGSSAELRLGDGEAVALDGFAVEGGTVRGRAALPIATQDGVDGVPNVSFELVRRGERLEGIASADLPGRCRVAHWVSLVRLREGLPSTPAGCLALVGGGGIPAGLYERVLAERLPAETRVAILSHASAAPGAGGRSEEAWRKHGVLAAQTIGPLTPLEEARSILEAAHVIWIPGGQQTRFMETLPRELADVVRGRLAAGAVAGGTSAGAAVASTIMIAGDAEEGEGRSSSLPRRGPGLGLWPDALVDQHFSERGRFPRLLAATLAQPEVIGVGLDEGTAVIVQGGRFEVLGRGTVTVIDARGAAVAAGSLEMAPTARDVRIHLLRDGMAFDLAPAPK